jgi:AhpD family alkylhydroperoxidase
MARISYVDEASLAPEAKAEWERLRKSRGGAVPGHLYQLLAHSPRLMGRWAAFAGTVRGYDPDGPVELEARSRELAILVVALCTGADYEWAAHMPIARREGVTEEQVAALLREDREPFSEKDKALLAYAAESTRKVQVSRDTFAALCEHFDERQILELTVAIGFYNCVARVVQALAIDLEPGMTGIPSSAAGQKIQSPR